MQVPFWLRSSRIAHPHVKPIQVYLLSSFTVVVCALPASTQTHNEPRFSRFF
jgi:hypothetical protein